MCDRISYKGFGGADRTIRVSKTNLESVLKTGNTLKTAGELFPAICYGNQPGSCASQIINPVVTSALWLSDGRSYKFEYTSFAEVARIETPSGGAVEFDHDYAQQNVTDFENYALSRLVKEKRIYVDADNPGSLESKTKYSRTPAYGAGSPVVTVQQTDAQDNLLAKTVSYFHGDPEIGFLIPVYEIAPWNNGLEFKTDHFASDGVTLLRRVSNTWANRVFPAQEQWTSPAPYGPLDPRLLETTTLFADTNQVSKKTFVYDDFNSVTDTYEYDFGTGAPGEFLRRSHTDYVTDTNYTSHTGAHLRGLPLQSWVSSDIYGNMKASLTQIEYDNYNTDANHAPLVSRLSVAGHDTANYDINNAKRGNATAVTSYADAQNQTGTITTYSQYDILGNVVKTIDAKGYASTVSYNDNFGSPDGEARSNTAPGQLNGQNTFAFATSATNALGWVTGYSQVDYFTGAAVNTEDINGVISKTFYNDPLDRPTQTVSAVGTAFEIQSNTVYDDVNRRIETKSDLNAINDNLVKAESFYDGLGRTFETRSYKDGGYVVSKTEFDALSRVKRVSNPYRPLLNEQPIWTESFYDSLGRVVKVKTPDNAEVLISYSGNTVTVTDQAGKQRRSISNALGQLTRVDEPNNAGQLGAIDSPNQPTLYTYDTLNNLTQVQQNGANAEQCGGAPNCSQTRTFVYDSLSRLKSATNPESGLIQYVYDNNGNLTAKTDARQVVTNYIYDALNRVMQRNYTAPPGLPNYQATPNVTYTYDDPLIANSKGKLTKVTNGISITDYVSFDILGHVTRSKQTTDGVVYGTDANPMTYAYNLSGALIEQKYPSGRIVKNVLDNDGDLSLVQSKKTSNHGYWNYANSFTYTAAGAVSSMQLGNGKWESTQFNTRLQPTQIALGQTQNATNLLKLNYSYGTTQNNGNLQSQTITVPMAGQNPGFVATQAYTYDSLNRLSQATETVPGQTGWQQTFTYDRYGNRNFNEAQTTTLPKNCGTPPNQTVCPADIPVVNPSVNTANNRLNGYVFDGSGNTTTDAESRTFTYDAENKQVKVEGNSQMIGEYWYDGDGKRIKKREYTNGLITEETIFVYDAVGKLVAEYSNQISQTPQVSYLTSDHLGSPRITTDANGQVISRRDFHPFGEEILTTERAQILGYRADDIRKKFTGYERDNESELDFAQARYYNPKHGRFTRPDEPFMDQSEDDPQSWNLYIYAGNNPVNITDPTGLWKWVDPDNNGNRFLEWEEGDSWESLAEFLNGNSNHLYLASDLAKFYSQTASLAEGQIIDTGHLRPHISNTGGIQDATLDLLPMGRGAQGVNAVRKTGIIQRGLNWLGQRLGIGLAKESVKKAPTIILTQFSMDTIEKGVAKTMKDKFGHIFLAKLHPKPQITALAQKVGGEEELVRTVLSSLNGKLPMNGNFAQQVTVAGQSVTVRGIVRDGIPVINTMF